MHSNTYSLIRRVTLRDLDGTSVIEVDGELDLVSGYDLRHAFATVLDTSTDAVTLDLSRVTAVDDQGVASLEWCAARASEANRPVAWTGCIHPFIRHLASRLAISEPLAHAGLGALH